MAGTSRFYVIIFLVLIAVDGLPVGKERQETFTMGQFPGLGILQHYYTNKL